MGLLDRIVTFRLKGRVISAPTAAGTGPRARHSFVTPAPRNLPQPARPRSGPPAPKVYCQAHLFKCQPASLQALVAAGAGGGHLQLRLEQVHVLQRQACGCLKDVAGDMHQGVVHGLCARVLGGEVGQESGWLAVGVVREVQKACGVGWQ